MIIIDDDNDNFDDDDNMNINMNVSLPKHKQSKQNIIETSGTTGLSSRISRPVARSRSVPRSDSSKASVRSEVRKKN